MFSGRKKIGPDLCDGLQRLNGVASRPADQRPAMVRLVGQHEQRRKKGGSLADDLLERGERCDERLARRTDYRLIVRRERIDVAQIARCPRLVERPADPFLDFRVAPGTQPARRVDGLSDGVRTVRRAPPRLGKVSLGDQPRRQPACAAWQRPGRQRGIERILTVPDLAHDGIGERVGQRVQAPAVGVRDDRRIGATDMLTAARTAPPCAQT